MSLPTSASLRERGNVNYRQGVAHASAGSPAAAAPAFRLALQLYERALGLAAAAADADAEASARKNAAAACVQLAACSEGRQAYEALVKAVPLAISVVAVGDAAGKDPAWLEAADDQATNAIYGLFEAAAPALSLYNDDDDDDDDAMAAGGGRPASPAATFQAAVRTASELVAIWEALPPAEASEQLRLDYASALVSAFERAATAAIDPERAGGEGGAAERGGWKLCLHLVAEAQRPLIEGLALAVEWELPDQLEELMEVEDRLFAAQCRCESTQARVQGDELVARVRARAKQGTAADGGDALLLDGVMSALDKYRQAVLLARERDLQAEAQAMSAMGSCYMEFAAQLDAADAAPASGAPAFMRRSAEERARAAYLAVITLVETLQHKYKLMTEDWFRVARDTISQYQLQSAYQEEKQAEALRAPIRQELAPQLRALNAASDKGWVALLKHVYAEHPPIKPKHRVPDDSEYQVDNGKELLRSAILAYHPDKQLAYGDGGFKRQVLCEEIAKSLNKAYTLFK